MARDNVDRAGAIRSGYDIHARSCMFSGGGHRDYIYFEAMHTRVDILADFPGACQSEDRRQVVGWTDATAQTEALAGDIAGALAALEAVGNRFDPASELSAVNRTACGRRVALSPKLYGILHRCLVFGRRTGGLFDITAGSFGNEPAVQEVVELSADGTVSFHNSRVRLDLSGVLKGFALDEIHALMVSRGIANAFVSVGTSSILAMGDHNPSDGSTKGWPVALRKLADGGMDEARGAMLMLCDECLTTSGNETRQRAHIINPLTGQMATGMRTASVVTNNGAEGEALSTACFLASDEQLARLRQEFKPRCIIKDGSFFSP